MNTTNKQNQTNEIDQTKMTNDVYKGYARVFRCGEDNCMLCIFLNKRIALFRCNPTGFLNEFFQEYALLSQLGFTSDIVETRARKIDRDSQRIEFTIRMVRNKIPLVFSAVSLRSGLAMTMAARQAVDYIVPLLHRWARVADAQMDSTQSTEQGPDTLTGEKSFGSIMTRDVPIVETLPSIPVEEKEFEIAKLTTGEECATFDVLQSRWTRLETFNFDTSISRRGVLLKEYRLPQALYSNTSAPNRLPFEQFAFCRPHYEIKIKINGHKFAQGKLLVSFFYEPSALGLANLKLPDLTEWRQGPLCWRNAIMRDHAFIDVSESNEVNMDIPYRNKQVWINTLPGDHLVTRGAWNVSVYIYVLSAVKAATDAPNSFPVTVYARLKNTQFTGIRNFKPVPTMDAQMGSSNSALEAGRTVLDGIGSIPIIGAFANATRKITGGIVYGITKITSSDAKTKEVERRLRYIGALGNRDKPTDWLQPQELRPNVVGNLSIGKGSEAIVPMRLDPYATTTQPQELLFPLPNDHILDMFRVWEFLVNFTWKMSDKPETRLETIQTSVFYSAIMPPNQKQDNLYLKDGLMQHYNYWAGSLEYRFDIVGTQYHNGILVATWMPEAGNGYSMVEGMSSYYKIFDLREAKSFTFVVPYISSTLMHLSAYSAYEPRTGIPSFTYGHLNIYVQNPLTPIPTIPTEVEVLVFMRVGPDFQTSYMRNNNVRQDWIFDKSLSYIRGDYPITNPADAQMDSGEKETLDTSPNFGLVPPVANIIQLAEDHGKIADIMRRWTLMYRNVKMAPITSYRACNEPQEKTEGMQWNAFYVSSFACTPWQYWPGMQDGVYYGSLQAYIARQFRWGRGSLRYLIVFHTQPGPKPTPKCKGLEKVCESCDIVDRSKASEVAREYGHNWAKNVTIAHIPQGVTQFLDPNYLNSAEAIASSALKTELLQMNGVSYATQYLNLEVNNTIKIEVPFHGIFNYLDMQCGLHNGTAEKEPSPYYLDIMARSLGSIVINADGDCLYNVYIAAGDDWEFSQFSPWAAHNRMRNQYPSDFASELLSSDVSPSMNFPYADSQMPDPTRDFNYARKQQEAYKRQQEERQRQQEIRRMQQELRRREEAERRMAEEQERRRREEERRIREREEWHEYQRRKANRQFDEPDVDSTGSLFPGDDTFGLTGPDDTQLPMTKLQGFRDVVTRGVSSTLNSISEPIKLAYNLPKRVDRTFMRWDNLGSKAETAFESLKELAHSITKSITSKCSWLTSISSIFSSILHFLQVLISPTWQTFVISFLGIISNLQLFSQDIILKLTGFFFRIKQRVFSEDQPTESQEADSQCIHNTCERCKNREECMVTCNYCSKLRYKKDYLFSDEEASNLIAILFAGLSAYWQYKGNPPETASYIKMLRISTTFWATARGAVGFLKIFIRLIRRLAAYMASNSQETLAAVAATEGVSDIQLFMEEVAVMSDQRNLLSLHIDPNLKYRFWCCVAKAHQLNILFSSKQMPNSAAILRACKCMIDLGNKESIQAMACPVRYEPYVLCLEGTTKIGKSYMMQDTVPELLADKSVYDIKTYDSPIFVRTPGVEFWNGYRNQPCILYDDFMAVNTPEIATKQVIELFNLKSSAIMNMNMAHLDDKALRGNPFLVALCANNAFVTMNGTTDPKAFLRRKDAVWRVELDPKWSDINSVPDEIKKTFKHLTFKKYSDSSDPLSLSSKPITFVQWKDAVKRELAEYHKKEKANVKRRMERLRLLLPETARNMLAETDPFHIFYAAYVQGAEESDLIQTGLLPSEVVNSELELITSMRKNGSGDTVTETIDRNEEQQPSTSASAQGAFSDWLSVWRDRITDLLWRPKSEIVPRHTFSAEIISQCVVCKEEKLMHSRCDSNHIHCAECIMGMRAATEQNEIVFSCALCRQQIYEVRYDPNLYTRYFIMSLYARKAWMMVREGAKRENLRRVFHSIYYDPRWRRMAHLGTTAFITLGYYSLFSNMKARIDAGKIARQNLDKLAMNPFWPVMQPTVKRWGPVWWVEEVKEPYWQWLNRREDFFEMYCDTDFRHCSYGLAQAPIPDLEKWPHLLSATSKHLMRGPKQKKEVIVAYAECPHKKLAFESAMYDDELPEHWRYDCFQPEQIPDAPCQFEDCPWRDPNVRHNFLNDWAKDHSAQLEEARANFSRVKFQWPYPVEYITEIVETAQQRALVQVKEQLGLQKKSLWHSLLPAWDSWKKWLKVATVMVGALVACIGSWQFVQWLVGRREEGCDPQLTNSGSFQNKKLAGHAKKLKRASGQLSQEKKRSAIKYIERNTTFINISYDENNKHKEFSLRCLGLFDRCVVLPKHYGLWLDSFLVRCERGRYEHGKLQAQSFSNPEIVSDMALIKGQILYTDNELAFLWLPKQFPIFKDIVSFLASESEHNHLAGEYEHIEPSKEDGCIHSIHGRIVDRLDTLTIKATHEFPQYDTFNVYEVTHGGKGCCGAIYLSNQEHPIFAMHIAGDNSNVSIGYGVALIREDIEAVREKRMALRVWEPVLKPAQDAQMRLQGCIVPHGCVNAEQVAYCPSKTKIVPSLLHSKIPGLIPHTQPGVLSGKDERYQFDKSPLYWGCMKHTKPPKDFDPILLERAAEGVKHDILQKMKPLRNLSVPLTLEQSVTGFKDLPYYDTVDLSTSAGWPWNCGQRKRKDEWMQVERDDNQFAVKVTFDKRLEEVMQLKDKQRLNGIKPLTVFLDWLKDERRKARKIGMKDGTRIFSLSPVDFTIQQRQLTLDFAASFMYYREAMEHAVGIAEDGPEWSRLAHFLLKKSDKIVTGDYSDFGPRLSAGVVIKAYEIMSEWYKQNGEINPEYHKKRMVMAEEVANCVHLVRDFMYTSLCGSPSGSSLTVIVNSLVNMIYMRYIWLYQFRGTNLATNEHFKKNVALKTYGDDLIMAVDSTVIEKFNCQTIGQAFQKLDIIFTDAGKTGTIKYVNLSEASFLKRGFKKHPNREWEFLAPLDEISIQDCPQWVWKSPDLQESTRLNCEQSLLLAFGHGPEYFKKWKKRLNEAMVAVGLEPLMTDWISLDEMFFGYQHVDEGVFTQVNKTLNLAETLGKNNMSRVESEAIGIFHISEDDELTGESARE